MGKQLLEHAWFYARALGALAGLALGWLFAGCSTACWVVLSQFNCLLHHGRYTRGRVRLRGSVIVLVLYVGLVGTTGGSSTQLPAGYIPPQDKGQLFISVQLPDAVRWSTPSAVVARISKILDDGASE